MRNVRMRNFRQSVMIDYATCYCLILIKTTMTRFEFQFYLRTLRIPFIQIEFAKWLHVSYKKKYPFFLMKEIESTCTVRATLPDEIWFVMCVLRHSEKNRVRWNLKNNRLPTATRDEFRLQLIHQKWYTCF